MTAGFMSNRPRLLDLFCGGGYASQGYALSGFDVVGVDINEHLDHPGSNLFCRGFRFIQADAITFAKRHASAFDAVHASPPCQAHSALRHLYPQREYECYIERTRDILSGLACPWVIENVVGAPLRNPVLICGSAFGLRVRRHRHFESNVALVGTLCRHKEQGHPIDVSGSGGQRVTRRVNDHGGACHKPRNVQEARQAIGADWGRRREIAQSIPPAYTEWIGRQLLPIVLAKQRENCATESDI